MRYANHPWNWADLGIVEDLGGISVIRGGGIQYLQGMSGKNVGSKGLSINVATVPPGAVAYAHIHDGFEVMLILQGKVKHTFGEKLEKEVINQAGDFIYKKRGAGGFCGPLNCGRRGVNSSLLNGPRPCPAAAGTAPRIRGLAFPRKNPAAWPVWLRLRGRGA